MDKSITFFATSRQKAIDRAFAYMIEHNAKPSVKPFSLAIKPLGNVWLARLTKP